MNNYICLAIQHIHEIKNILTTSLSYETVDDVLKPCSCKQPLQKQLRIQCIYIHYYITCTI